jgi:hypothetical protein
MDERLARFVEHARRQGVDHGTLRQVLRDAGWKSRQVDEVLFAREVGMPVPEPEGASSARDTFLHLLSFTALYTWVISLVVLYFTYVNVALPEHAWEDDSWVRENVRGAIRWGLASIVVAYPLFLLLWRSVLRSAARQPEKGLSGPRRWLTYLSLFVGAVTLLSDVITLVYYLFEGELTLRFVLKVGILFAITGAVFAYLALTLRGAKEAPA